MKVLVAGLGSIGQRHVRNLRALLGSGVEILAYRVRGLPHVITETMTIEAGQEVAARYGVRTFDSLDQALAERPSAVLVCNPTSLHMATALAAVRAGCHVFIEKPLSHTLDGVEELISIAERNRCVVAVGYQMRYHPALQRLRELLASNAIGTVTAVRAEMAEYLPASHPYEDYRPTYAARRELGGGVILCFAHEFDYLYWLFGMPTVVSTVGGCLGDLDIDVEDTAVSVMQHQVAGRAVAVHLRQSFLQYPASRWCEVEGTEGTIRIDFSVPMLTRTDGAGAGVEHRTFDGFTRNQLFVDELTHFLSAIAGDERAPIVPARDAVCSLRMALAARESLRTGCAVEIAS